MRSTMTGATCDRARLEPKPPMSESETATYGVGVRGAKAVVLGSRISSHHEMSPILLSIRLIHSTARLNLYTCVPACSRWKDLARTWPAGARDSLKSQLPDLLSLNR